MWNIQFDGFDGEGYIFFGMLICEDIIIEIRQNIESFLSSLRSQYFVDVNRMIMFCMNSIWNIRKRLVTQQDFLSSDFLGPKV